LFSLDKLVIEKPEVAKVFEKIRSWGENEAERMIIYTINLLELVNDMRIEKIIGLEDWEPWRRFLVDTASSQRFQEFWSILRTTGVYSPDIVKIVDDAIAEASKKKIV